MYRFNFQPNPGLYTPFKHQFSRHESPQLSHSEKIPRSPSTGSLPPTFHHQSYSPGTPVLPENPLSRFIGRFLSGQLSREGLDDSVPEIRAEKSTVSTSAPLPTFTEKSERMSMSPILDEPVNKGIEIMANHIFNAAPREIKIRSHCYELATEYQKCQEIRVKKLYRCIKTQAPPDEGEFKLFERFCNLHCAIEELWFPFPKQFKEAITKLGYIVLDKDEFLQFVERGVFEITPNFVEKILPRLTNIDYSNFKYLLLSKLPEEASINLLEKDNRTTTDKEAQNDFLLDYKLRQQRTNYKGEAVDMENVLGADFLPLSIYLESLKTAYHSSTELNWMCQTALGGYNKAFDSQKESH